VTIGLSSASKIWSNTSFSPPELLAWCKNLARKILDERATVTGSNLDLLQMGEIASKMSARALWGEWDKEVYIETPLARLEVGGRPYEDALTQFNLDVEQSDDDGVLLLLEGPNLGTRILGPSFLCLYREFRRFVDV
jgi:hypothetical protein